MVMIVGIHENDKTRNTAGTGGIHYISRKPSAIGNARYLYTNSGFILKPIVTIQHLEIGAAA